MTAKGFRNYLNAHHRGPKTAVDRANAERRLLSRVGTIDLRYGWVSQLAIVVSIIKKLIEIYQQESAEQQIAVYVRRIDL